MDIFLVNKEDPCAQSLSVKLSDTRPNQIIPLTNDEMDLFNSDGFKHLTYGNDHNKNIVEVEPGKSYIFVCDENTNIDDVMVTAKRLEIQASIIRVKS